MRFTKQHSALKSPELCCCTEDSLTMLKKLLLFQVSLNKMKITEGMGFSEQEAKQILLRCPLVFKHKFEDTLQANFEVLHVEVSQPRVFRLRWS